MTSLPPTLNYLGIRENLEQDRYYVALLVWIRLAILAPLDVQLSRSLDIPKHTLHSDELSVHRCLLDSCQPVQFKLHTAPLNYSLPHYLAKPGPTRQQTQLVNSVKPGVPVVLWTIHRVWGLLPGFVSQRNCMHPSYGFL